VTLRHRRILEGITRVRGMRGAMLVAADDGLVVAEALMEGIRGNALAALAASMVKRLGLAGVATGIGEVRFLHLQGAEGAMLVMPAPEEMVLVAVGEADVNVGLARLEMLQAVRGLT